MDGACCEASKRREGYMLFNLARIVRMLGNALAAFFEVGYAYRLQ